MGPGKTYMMERNALTPLEVRYSDVTSAWMNKCLEKIVVTRAVWADVTASPPVREPQPLLDELLSAEVTPEADQVTSAPQTLGLTSGP